MNRYWVSIVTSILMINICFSSSYQDSLSVYDYWAKKGIVELTFIYMNEYIKSKNDSITQEELLGRDKYEDNFIRPLQTKEDLINLSEVSYFLKNNSWNNTEEKLFQSLNDKYKRKIQIVNLFSECPQGIDCSNWYSKKNEIINEFKHDLLQLESQENSNKIYSKKKSSVGEKYNYNTFFYIVSLIFSFFIGALMVYIINKVTVKSILKVEYNDYLFEAKNKTHFFDYLKVVSRLQNRKEELKNEKNHLDEKNKRLEKEKKTLNEKLKKLQNEANSIVTKNKNTQQFSVEPEEQTQVNEEVITAPLEEIKSIYFNIPENDGSFNILDGDNFLDSKKYYKINFVEDKITGDLIYVSSEGDKRAINQIEDFLKPVCDIENIADASNASRVELIKKGKVTLQGSKWIIDPKDKIKIRLV